LVTLCVLDRSVRDAAVQSISDWKNGYPLECGACAAHLLGRLFLDWPDEGEPRHPASIAAVGLVGGLFSMAPTVLAKDRDDNPAG
jgi:hypothetical protein